MAGSGNPFDDLNRRFSDLGFNGNKDEDKKKRPIYSNNGGGRSGGGGNQKELSLGEKVAVGTGVGLAVGAGIAALSYLFSGSDDKAKPSESRSLPSRGIGYVYDGGDDDSSDDENVGRLEVQAQSAFRSTTGQESRKYGYFRCNNCQHSWESAYTFSKGNKAVSSFFMNLYS